MRPKRHLIYICGNLSKKELVYTGIDFHDFITGIKQPIHNLILLKGEYSKGLWCDKYNFELIVGAENIKKFSNEDIYQFGDFGFVDYLEDDAPNKLSAQEVAELLYLSHVHRPVNSPFFDVLSNRFVYIAHDDGFYCKLICKDVLDFVDVIANKIQKVAPICISTGIELNEFFLSSVEQGMFFDLDEIQVKSSGFQFPVYLIGRIDNMDTFYHSYDELAKSAQAKYLLSYGNCTWRYDVI